MSILGLGSGLLGQLGEAAGAPRRALWSMLGLPETGSELVSNLTGMDKENPWNQALGVGAEVLGDPLNLFAPLVGRLGQAATRLGPKYRGLMAEAGALPGEMSKATEAAGVLHGADDAVLAEQAAMRARHADEAARLAGIGEEAMPQGDTLQRLMAMDTAVMSPDRLARDALMPTSPIPMKMGRTTPDVEQGLRAMGLAMSPEGGKLPMIPGMKAKSGRTPRAGRGASDAASGYMTTPPPVPGLEASGVGRNRLLGATEDFPFVPPPGNDYPASVLGFSPETRSSYLPVLEGRQQDAKNALMDVLDQVMPKAQRIQQGLDQYAIPAFGPWEMAMLGGGAGAVGLPAGGLGRRERR